MRVKPSFLISFLAAVTPAVHAANGVDTSDWNCEFCPFEDGVSGDYDVGATSVSDDAAYLGNATGYDEEGIYANVDGDGGFTSDRQRVRWRIEDLGLDSRSIAISGGAPGSYDYRADWSELPYRRFFSTATVFADAGDASLVLPEDWVRAPTTGGFSALDANLTRRNIESDRKTLGLGGSYRLAERLRFSADYRRRENEGVRVVGGSTFTNASQLPAPFDHSTDEFELAVRYGTERAFIGLSWYLSDFDNQYTALGWQQPFTTAEGAGSPQIAQAPDNRFQQLRLSGGYLLSTWHTVINMTAAVGQIEQDAPFLDYTTNPNLTPAPLPRSDLDGEVDTTNLHLSLSARPMSAVRVRASYRFDERDNNTPVALYSRVIADSFLSGEAESNSPFGYRRSRLTGDADWDALKMFRVSAGFEFSDYDRTLQEVSSQEEFLSYGRVRLRPVPGVEFDARYGNSRREIDRYDEALAVSLGQNPLLRKYNLAFRFRDFVDLRASWSPAGLPVAVTLTGVFADDSYTHSRLGLTDGKEQNVSVDVSWFLNEKTSLFLNAGVDLLEADQLGSEGFGAPDWSATTEDSFSSWGAGFTIDDVAERFDIRFSASSSRGESEITIDSASAGRDPFPDLETDYDRLHLDVRYAYSDRLDVTLGTTYQRFKTSDWALQNVRPDTVSQLFTLGARPYDEETIILTIGARYRMGTR